MKTKDELFAEFKTNKINYMELGTDIKVWFDSSKERYEGVVINPMNFRSLTVIISTNTIIPHSFKDDINVLIKSFNNTRRKEKWILTESDKVEIHVQTSYTGKISTTQSLKRSIVHATRSFNRIDREIQKWMKGEINMAYIPMNAGLKFDKEFYRHVWEHHLKNDPAFKNLKW